MMSLARKVVARILKNAGDYFSVGSKIYFGKYKNSLALIVGFGYSEKGAPTVKLQPIDKLGNKRGGIREQELFRISKAEVIDKARAEAKALKEQLAAKIASRSTPIKLTVETTQRYTERLRQDFGFTENKLARSLKAHSWLFEAGEPVFSEIDDQRPHLFNVPDQDGNIGHATCPKCRTLTPFFVDETKLASRVAIRAKFMNTLRESAPGSWVWSIE